MFYSIYVLSTIPEGMDLVISFPHPYEYFHESERGQGQQNHAPTAAPCIYV